MSDKKISQLTALTGANTAADDVLAIVDTNAAETKKIRADELFKSLGAGTAAAPAITPAGDQNTGIFFPAADTIAFSEGGVEGMRIDSSGNLLVGTTSTAQARADFRKTDNTAYTTSSSGNLLSLRNESTTAGTYSGIQFIAIGNGADVGSAHINAIQTASGSAALAFSTRNSATTAERVRIDSSGNLLVGTTTADGLVTASSGSNTFIENLKATNASYSSTVLQVQCSRNTTNVSYYLIKGSRSGVADVFRVADSGDVTNINGTYGAISDAKMKTDIVDAGSQWNDIKALRFRKFKLKDDPEGIIQLGVVAQEVEEVSPGLVSEHTDRDAEGNDLGTTTKSVKTSVLLMKAAVALQEAMTRIEALEVEVQALKSK